MPSSKSKKEAKPAKKLVRQQLQASYTDKAFMLNWLNQRFNGNFKVKIQNGHYEIEAPELLTKEERQYLLSHRHYRSNFDEDGDGEAEASGSGGGGYEGQYTHAPAPALPAAQAQYSQAQYSQAQYSQAQLPQPQYFLASDGQYYPVQPDPYQQPRYDSPQYPQAQYHPAAPYTQGQAQTQAQAQAALSPGPPHPPRYTEDPEGRQGPYGDLKYAGEVQAADAPSPAA